MAGKQRENTPSDDLEVTRSAERPRRAPAPPRVARLVVVYPRAQARSYPLADATVTLGRHASGAGTELIDHPTVSRQHAAIRWDRTAGRHNLADLGSRNGTWLEGQPIASSPRFIDDNAVLRIGDVLAVYERGDLPPAAPQVAHSALPGQSLAVQELRAAVARAATDHAPALILGDTGVGKERVAAELHRLGRRGGPLIAVNCAALSAQLIESQLFGHVRGAFTGATAEHSGLFRAAAGGSLFLDEIGEMPLDLQPKLLRAAELGEVIAVGSTQAHRVDVRLIAATNRSLAGEVEAGRFRRDLYARLALWELQVPPLRSRRVDIIGWIDRLHAGWHEPRGGAPAPLDLGIEAAEALLLSPWTDNLRGVQRFVHGCGAAAPRIEHEMLPSWLSGEEPAAPVADVLARPHFRPRPSRDELVAVLDANAGSLRAAARHFERDRKQIVRWVEMYAIEIPGRTPG